MCITVIRESLHLRKHKRFKMEESLINNIIHTLHNMFNNVYAVIVGLAVSLVGYLTPVKDIVNLLIVFFIIDVLVGYWAARKLRQERFSVKIIWSHTIPRMLLSIVIITGAFMWDKVYDQDIVSTYKLIGWFLSGVLLYSIAENAYQITKWSVFPKISGLMSENVKERTGLDIEDTQTTPTNGSENN